MKIEQPVALWIRCPMIFVHDRQVPLDFHLLKELQVKCLMRSTKRSTEKDQANGVAEYVRELASSLPCKNDGLRTVSYCLEREAI